MNRAHFQLKVNCQHKKRFQGRCVRCWKCPKCCLCKKLEGLKRRTYADPRHK